MDLLPYLRYVFLALFAVDSVLNLFCGKKNITKALLLPLLAGYYLTSADNVSWLLVGALAASWLGDVLLMNPDNAWFTAGGISFMAAHFLFIAVYAANIDLSMIRYSVAIPAALVYFGVSAAVIYILRPYTPKAMAIPMYVYLLANSLMNLFAILQFMSVPSAAALTACFGALLFFVSDCTLFIVRFYKNGRFKSFFLCMLTYITGEFLITQGILLLK